MPVQTMLEIADLPKEILEVIFSSLDSASVMAASLVSSTWNSVIEQPRFWRWARLRVDRENYDHVLESNRVNIVEEINIVVDNCPASRILNILENLFTDVVVGDLELRTLKVTGGDGSELVDLPSLHPVLVSRALIMLEECSLESLNVLKPLTTAQLVAVFTAIGETNNMKLKTLNLPNRDYNEIPPEVLAAALVKLEETNILELSLSPAHVRGLFSKLAESSTVNIKSLDLDRMKCSDCDIPPELFGEALVRITRLRKFEKITMDQVESFFRKMASASPEELRLRVVCLSSCFTTISHIPPWVVSEGVARLERFCTYCAIPSGNLTAEQISALFTRLSAVDNSSLRTLSIRYNNLSSLPTETLVAGISGLELVWLRFTQLTSEQLDEIYRLVAERRSPRLRWISLGANDHRNTSVEIRHRAHLNRSVQMLDKYNLICCCSI